MMNFKTAIFLLLLCSPASLFAQTSIQLTESQRQIIGNKIWHNEGLGKVENLTVWNKGEDFPSFGIGHFIWYPAGVNGPFTESFPQLLTHFSQTTVLPGWLNDVKAAPWHSREHFYQEINSPKLKSLRTLLQQTMPQQVEFIVLRMEAALPKILHTLPTQTQRDHVQTQFYRVAGQANGTYALIDYVNFKGEGTSTKERYQGQGWGLLQVLENMGDDNDVMQEFVRAADFVLTRRVQNAPRDETRWLPGWRNRLRTYLEL